jgi:hypothetical protein
VGVRRLHVLGTIAMGRWPRGKEKIRYASIGLRIAVVALFTAAANAQSTKPSYDWSTPAAAYVSLQLAMNQYDEVAVSAHYYAATDDERAALDAMSEDRKASLALHKACLDHFGRDSSHSVQVEIGRVEAEVQGDTATVYPGGKKLGLRIKCVRVDGEWKMAMSDVLDFWLRTDKTLDRALARKRAWTRQVMQLAGDVKAGRYSSPDAVVQALGDLADTYFESAASKSANK